jgi:type II secretory pathway component PulJ
MKFKIGEKGLTLLELIIGLGIGAAVVVAASTAIVTMARLSPRNADWDISLSEVQNAGYWISRDVQMSLGTVTVGTGNPTFLTLILPQTNTDNKTVVYQFQDMSGGLKRLIRNDQTANQQKIIAEYISVPMSPVYNTDNRTLTFSLTATSGQVPVTKQYKATQRVPPVP